MTGKHGCRVCGGSFERGGGKSREHIIPAWMQEEFGLSLQQITYTPLESSQIPAPMQLTPGAPAHLCRQHNYDSLVLGRVCQSCNGGWMSAIETAAKTDLIDLITGKSTTNADNVAIARWALKTAYTLCTGTDAPIGRVPRRHMAFLKSQRGLPRGVSVFFRLDDQEEWWFSMATTFLVSVDPDVAAPITEMAERHFRNAFCYFFRLGRLTLLCEFWPDDGAVVAYQPGLLSPIHCERNAVGEDDGLPGFDERVHDLVLRGTRYHVQAPWEYQRQFCVCGSGLVAQVCSLQGHPTDTAGNWGWLPIAVQPER